MLSVEKVERSAGSERGLMNVHFPNQLLLRFGAEVAVDGGLDFEKVLYNIFQAICTQMSLAEQSY